MTDTPPEWVRAVEEAAAQVDAEVAKVIPTLLSEPIDETPNFWGDAFRPTLDLPAATSKVLVIRTAKMERVRTFFESTGLTFVEEQHEKGPRHYACEQLGHVLEIYPVGKRGEGVKFYE